MLTFEQAIALTLLSKADGLRFVNALSSGHDALIGSANAKKLPEVTHQACVFKALFSAERGVWDMSLSTVPVSEWPQHFSGLSRDNAVNVGRPLGIGTYPIKCECQKWYCLETCCTFERFKSLLLGTFNYATAFVILFRHDCIVCHYV